MVLLWRFGNVRVVFLLIAVQWFMYTHAELSICSKSKEGSQTLYRKVSGDDGVLICIKKSGRYVWKFLDGSSTLGEKFNPAKDCSDIVDNLPGAKDGFYWIKHNKGHLCKGWCDTHTDSGGFLLIGMNNSPVTWNVPSNDTPVNPVGPPHWSSKFGDVNVQDFAIQISTTKNFEDTMAHWSYRLKTNPALGNLFGVGSGGCTDIHSGIGNVSYVKDILTGAVVTTNFNCSKFGPHQDFHLGWGRMNYCLRNKCPLGYAFFKGVPLKLDNHGSFSYSASSEFSGITHDATAFFGCDAGKCCACFGPKGGRGHYCSKKCQAVNGGTVLTGKVYVWYWIRTRMPKKVWKRCMEFKMKSAAGKFETYYIDRNTGIAHKGTCSEHFQTFLNEGTLLVKNKESFNNLPAVPGLLSYREDNEKLYVNNGSRWDEISSKKEQDARFKTLKKNMTAMLQSLEDHLETIERKLNAQNMTKSAMMPTTSTTNTTMLATTILPTNSTSQPITIATTTPKPGCVADVQPDMNCQYWAALGYCQATYVAYMEANCCQTCKDAQNTTNSTMMPTTNTTNTTMMPTTSTTSTTMMPTMMPTTNTTNTTMMPTTNTTNTTMMPTTSTTNTTMMPTTNTTNTTMMPTTSTTNTTMMPTTNTTTMATTILPTNSTPQPTTIANTTLIPVGCQGNLQANSYCKYWKGLGYCQNTHVAYMLINCCQICNDGCVANVQSDSNCQYWAALGYCQTTHVAYMEANCCQTCKDAKCTDKDTRGYCPEWKTYGFCGVGNQHFQYMQENCAKTCDKCL